MFPFSWYIKTYLSEFNHVIIKFPLIIITKIITREIHRRINDQIESIHKQLQEGVPTETKQTKSWLPFIGSISHALFGTATEEDLEATKQQTQQIMNKGRAATQVFDQQIR